MTLPPLPELFDQVEAARVHARYKEINKQVLAMEDLRSIATDLLLSASPFSGMVPDAGFEIEDLRHIVDARANALAQALQQDRIDFASCETTLRAAWQQLMPSFVLELKPPGDDRTSYPCSLVGLNVSFKAVALLLTRSAEERRQLLDTNDFVPPVRAPPPLPRCQRLAGASRSAHLTACAG